MLRILYRITRSTLTLTLTLRAHSSQILIDSHSPKHILYSSYIKETWNIGVTSFIITIATAFIGYVLPWGQIRFWGATVITNIFSAIPYIGKQLVEWLWGGFAVSNPTLSRFFIIHFILPLIIIIIVAIHLVFLHTSGSNNPLGTHSNRDRIPFPPIFYNQGYHRIYTSYYIINSNVHTNTKYINRPRKLHRSKYTNYSNTYSTRMIFPMIICHPTIRA